MQMQSTFDPPWDFVNVWQIDEGNDYPRLRSEPPPLGPTESSCTNTLDDDCDSLIDCADPDCATNPACLPEGIPATSTWGIVVLALLVTTAGSFVLLRRRPDSVDCK
jgi:hypothetical protein